MCQTWNTFETCSDNFETENMIFSVDMNFSGLSLYVLPLLSINEVIKCWIFRVNGVWCCTRVWQSIFIGKYSKESLVVGQNWLVDGPTKRVMTEYQSIHCEGLRISSQPLMIKPTKHGNHQMWLHNITQLYKLHKSSNAAVDLNYDECKPLEFKNIAMWRSMNMIRVTWKHIRIQLSGW